MAGNVDFYYLFIYLSTWIGLLACMATEMLKLVSIKYTYTPS